MPGSLENQKLQGVTSAKAPREAAAKLPWDPQDPQDPMSQGPAALRIAVLSDNHGMLDDATTTALRDLRPCLVLHAGTASQIPRIIRVQ